MLLKCVLLCERSTHFKVFFLGPKFLPVNPPGKWAYIHTVTAMRQNSEREREQTLTYDQNFSGTARGTTVMVTVSGLWVNWLVQQPCLQLMQWQGGVTVMLTNIYMHLDQAALVDHG